MLAMRERDSCPGIERVHLCGELFHLPAGRGLAGFVLLGHPPHDPGGESRGHRAEQRDARDHQGDRDAPASIRVVPAT